MVRPSKAPARKPARHPAGTGRSGGATLKAPRRTPRKAAVKGSGFLRRLLLRITVAVAALGVFTGVVVWAQPLDYLQQIANRPIAGVIVAGEFRYLSGAKIQALLNERVTGTFLQLDMEALRLSIEENPWVDSASVSRQWPDRLMVRIQEQQPIARWGDDALLNMRGDIVDVKDNKPLAHLPLLHGEDRYAREVMEKYVRMARLLATANLELSEVHMDRTLAWTLSLRNGIRLRLGRDQVFEKLQRLLQAYPYELAQRVKQIETIDLRYDNGFAVAWKKSETEQLAMADGDN